MTHPKIPQMTPMTMTTIVGMMMAETIADQIRTKTITITTDYILITPYYLPERPSYKPIQPLSLIMALKLNGLPCILAKFQRTARVFAGWTIHHPRHPPKPDVAKITVLGIGAAVAEVAK